MARTMPQEKKADGIGGGFIRFFVFQPAELAARDVDHAFVNL